MASVAVISSGQYTGRQVQLHSEPLFVSFEGVLVGSSVTVDAVVISLIQVRLNVRQFKFVQLHSSGVSIGPGVVIFSVVVSLLQVKLDTKEEVRFVQLQL